MEDICATKIIDDELEEAYLTNLTPNTEYEVQISMVSESQSGDYSEMKKCKTLEEGNNLLKFAIKNLNKF